MMSEPADVAVAEQDGVLVLSVGGDLDAREPLLDGHQKASVRTKARGVLLDLGRCAYINSSGIALIVGLLALCRADGRQLSARDVSAHYRRLLDITRISDHLHVLPEENEEKTA
jgi:anti-anti-sigma factor